MPEYLVGIDLGTSNCAIAYVEKESIIDFPVTQVRRPGDVAPNGLLPSAIYLPGEEVPPESIALPWDPNPKDVVGEFARWQGSRVPSRLIVSAKSWLSHSGVDRAAPILP